jgi:hypothetical protein
MESLIVPSAIQRIRSFLVEMSGMKVKPWATTEETLAALHTTLVARRQCPMFWTSLRGLLETLARDLKARQEALPGTLVDNELLDSERYATLLDEIRAVLAVETAQPATFRRLAAALSAPALGLLMLLGGAVTVGCDHSTLHGATRDAGLPDVSDAKITEPASSPDLATIHIQLPDVSPDVLPDASPDVLPDASRAPDAFAPSQFDGATVTIEDILQSCNIPPAGVLNCLAKLRASWTTGVAGALAGMDCNSVEKNLSCFLQQNCTGTPSAKDFSQVAAFYCPPVIIYAGVRFV